MSDLPPADPRELAAFTASIRELYDLKERAFAAGDALPIVNRFYLGDAVTVGPDGKVVEGRDEFRKAYESMVRNKTVRIESLRTYVRGDVGWDWTNFHVMPTDPAKAPTTLIILFLWLKAEGRWVSAGDAYVVGEFPRAS
jgi:uncharacterized protein (TIGR02246 family)